MLALQIGQASATPTVVTDAPSPELAAGSVLLRVEAAGLGSWDANAVRGAFAGMGGWAEYPQTLGWDVTGVVEAVGDGVADLAVGDAVLGFTPQPFSRAGTAAERVVLPAANVCRRPDGLGVEQAAVAPVVLLTARALLAAAGPDLGPGRRVAVVGAAGGVGAPSVRLAADTGAEVVGIAGTGDAGRVRAAGATSVLAPDTLAALGELDVVLDTVGLPGSAGVVAALRTGGRYVGTVPGGQPTTEGLRVEVVGVMPDGPGLAPLAERAARGELPLPVTSRTVRLVEGATVDDLGGRTVVRP